MNGATLCTVNILLESTETAAASLDARGFFCLTTGHQRKREEAPPSKRRSIEPNGHEVAFDIRSAVSESLIDESTAAQEDRFVGDEATEASRQDRGAVNLYEAQKRHDGIP